MYTSEQRIENYLMTNIDPAFRISQLGKNQITEWIEMVQIYIDKYIGKKDGFDADTVATDRYYDGNGERELTIDDCISVSDVVILEAYGTGAEWTLTVGVDNDYVVYPYNDLPIYKLILVPNGRIGAWMKGKRRIKITAKWGHSSSVPEDIRLAATMLVSGIIEKGLRGGKVRSESLGDYSITYDDIEDSAQHVDVKGILDSYKIFKF